MTAETNPVLHPDRNLAMELVRATEAAAIRAYPFIGHGDKNAADGAAVDAMRAFLGTVNFEGLVVIGEGEKDDAPMLFNGEKVGTGLGPKVDIAVDPIDGTTNFLHGIPHFAICIALQSKKEIVSGLIFDPIKDEMFFAEKDKGAFLNNQRLRVSKKNSIDDCLFSSNHEGVKFSDLNMRYSGCAALDLAYVASGRLDGFFHNDINLWDVAAGEILVKEAGGLVNDIHKFDVNKIDIRASSAAINDKMLENLVNF